MERIVNYIKNSRLFFGLNDGDLHRIAREFNRVEFTKGETIFEEGDVGDKMYLIIDGEAFVLKKLGLGERELRRLSTGDCFGEMAIISDDFRSATIKAVGATVCMEMTKGNFKQFINEIHQLSINIIKILNDRIITSESAANKNILDAYKALVFSLSTLAEFRDPETGGHLSRVRAYCRLLSEKLAEQDQFKGIISQLFIDNIFTVSPLHDAGKVGIIDGVLLKPGKLSVDEFDVMKQHTMIGAMAIEKALEKCDHPTFLMAYNIAYYHHERYDGMGYPSGLAADRIPLEARIMALADVYDALLSKRVYKPAFSYHQARQIIEEGSGTQFDPVLTQTMLDNIEDFQVIHQTFADE